MGDMLIRNVPEQLKNEIAARAAKSGRSLSEEAKVLLRRSLLSDAAPEPAGFANAYDAIRSAFEEHGGIDDAFADMMDEIEAERKRDFGRPVPDLE